MVQPGTTEVLTYEVTDADLASALALADGDTFPPLLATARVVGLMELAAARLMRPLLGPDQLSVGVAMEIDHTAPTPVGASVEVRATYDGVEGRLHRFDIEASDPGGTIARSRHTRAVIDPAKLTERAEQRRRATG